MKTIFTVACLLCLFTPVADNPQLARLCKLKLADTPEIRGLKLGMSPTEVIAQYNVLIEDLNKDGLFEGRIHGNNRDETLSGIREIEVVFLDERLVSFRIEYDGSVRWGNLRAFTDRLAMTLALPADGWETGNGILGEQIGSLQCDGVNLTASISQGRAALSLSETGYYKIVRERQREKEKKSREGFRP